MYYVHVYKFIHILRADYTFSIGSLPLEKNVPVQIWYQKWSHCCCYEKPVHVTLCI